MSAKDHVFTLGIEEEFAIVDPETRELRSHIHEILEDGKVTLKEQIKPEMHQSVVELGTEICRDIDDARTHVTELRSRLAALAGRAGSRSHRSARILFRTGAISSSPRASATRKLCETCNCWPGRISSSDCMFMWEFPIAKRPSTS